jgi:hypothetical protein
MDQNQAETNYQLKYTVSKLGKVSAEICKRSVQAGGNK